MSNRELINKFLAYLKRDGKSVLTLSAYATDLKQFGEILGDKKIVELSKEAAAGLPSHFAQEATRDKRPLANNSLARKVTSLREFLRWGYRKGYLERDLAREIEIPRRKTIKILTPLSSNKLYKLKRKADTKERLILELILGAGMRLSEIVKIRMKDITRQKLSHLGGQVKIPITGQLRQAMEYYLATYSRGPRSTLIFSQRTGREITTRTASNILNKLAKKAGVKDVTASKLKKRGT